MAEALATIQGYEVTLQMEVFTRTQKDGEAAPCTQFLLFITESNLINVLSFKLYVHSQVTDNSKNWCNC